VGGFGFSPGTDELSILNMFRSIAREFHWAPEILGALYFDREDHYGLVFWIDDIKESHEDLKTKKK